MAVDMFLKIDGIDGDTTSHKHKGEIELLSFAWGLSNSGSSSSGGGGGAGKPVVQDFSIVKQLGSNSPELMEKCCRGEHIPSIQMSLSNKESGQDFYKIKLTDVLVSSYQTGGANTGGGAPVEQVSFSFRSVDIQAADRKGNFSQVSCDFLKGTTNNIGHDH